MGDLIIVAAMFWLYLVAGIVVLPGEIADKIIMVRLEHHVYLFIEEI